MNLKINSLYNKASLYDLVMGKYATGVQLDFYEQEIIRLGQPILELACGTGRLTLPLAKKGFAISGLDLSPTMLDLARTKALEGNLNVRIIEGDMCNFNLGETFSLILLAAQSLSHLHTLEEIEACFSAVHKHLKPGGHFIIELFNPSMEILNRDSTKRYALRNDPFETPDGISYFVTEQSHYDSATQVNHITWFFQREEREETQLSLNLRQFFPQEIDALLHYNGFKIEAKYGDFQKNAFTTQSHKQVIVSRTLRVPVV